MTNTRLKKQIARRRRNQQQHRRSKKADQSIRGAEEKARKL
jgi:hypothetical protein